MPVVDSTGIFGTHFSPAPLNRTIPAPICLNSLYEIYPGNHATGPGNGAMDSAAARAS